MRANDLRVLVLADAATTALVRESVLTSLPTTELAPLGAAELAARQIPAAGAAIADAGFDGGRGLDALRSLRASGFDGAAVLIVPALEASVVARAIEVGVRCVIRDTVATALPELLAATTEPPELSVAWRELRRVQRLVAAGEIARGFQHEVNNPLTALLAEAQMLAMEPLDEGPRGAAERIVALCRRVIESVRRFDAARPAGGEEPTQA